MLCVVELVPELILHAPIHYINTLSVCLCVCVSVCLCVGVSVWCVCMCVCSIMGEGGELGIVPRFAEELFARVDGTEDSKVAWQYCTVCNVILISVLQPNLNAISTGV